MSSCYSWLLVLLMMLSHASVAAEISGVPMRLALGRLPPINCENSSIGALCVNNKIVERLQHFSGVDIQTQVVPYARVKQMLQNNQADMALTLENDNMPSNTIGVAKIYDINLSVYTRLDAENLDLSQLRIGVLRGQGNNIIEHLSGADLMMLNEYRQGVEMLSLGRLDALLGPGEVLNFLFEKYKLSNKLSSRSFLNFNQEVWLYCRQDACEGDRLRWLKQAVVEMQPEIMTVRQMTPAACHEE